MSSVIALNQIDGSELWKKVGFKPSEKVLVSLRGVYNLPFNLDDPVDSQENKFYELREYDKMDQASVVDGGEGNLIQINVLFIAIDNGS